MKKLDKKQVPQVALLSVMCVALFGYFAKSMILPSPAAARSVAPAATVAVAPAPAETPAAPADVAPPAADGPVAADVPAPTPSLRDPFAQNVGAPPAPVPATLPAAPPAARVASLPPAGVSVPSAPALPFPAMGMPPALGRAGTGSLPPLPVAPPWTVTGVLQSGGERIVILRSGDARRIVKQGDYVDSDFRVAKVSRTAVILQSNRATFTLPLGGSKTAPATKATGFPTPASLSGPASPMPSLMPTPRMMPPAVRPDLSQSAPRSQVVTLKPHGLPAALEKAAQSRPVIRVADSRSEWKTDLKAVYPTLNWNQVLKPAVHRRAARVQVHVPKIASPALAQTLNVSAQTFAPKVAALLQTAKAPVPVQILIPQTTDAVNVQTLRPAATVAVHVRRPAARLKIQVRVPSDAVALFDPADAVPMAGLPTVGTLAPEFSLPTLSGPHVALSDLHGRVVVLNFWASWVPGCVKQMSALRALQSSCGGRGLSILNINTWDNADAAAAMLDRLPALSGPRLYDELYDPSVANDSVAVSLYHAPDVPTIYVIDRDGTIAATFIGVGERVLASLRASLKSLGVL